ncbi:hypothetical protein ACWIG5_23720 [Streptomyces lydicus]
MPLWLQMLVAGAAISILTLLCVFAMRRYRGSQQPFAIALFPVVGSIIMAAFESALAAFARASGWLS